MKKTMKSPYQQIAFQNIYVITFLLFHESEAFWCLSCSDNNFNFGVSFKSFSFSFILDKSKKSAATNLTISTDLPL